jgi:branched-chain amino acid transport system permease protein
MEKLKSDGIRMNAFQRLSKAGKRKVLGFGLGAVAVIIFAVMPFFVDVNISYFGYYFFIVCLYATVSQGWNLVAGYTGQISLAGNAFFGLGAYTMAMLWWFDVTKTTYFFDPLLMILAGITPILLALIIGYPLLSRLRGDYFSFGTLGMGMIVTALFLNGGSFTRGAEGIYLESSRFTSLDIYYWVALALAVFATLVVYFMANSRIGLALKAIREDEVSAASHGINVLKYKLYAFMVSAFLAGIAGSIFGYYQFHVEPRGFFSMNWLFYPILMVVLGGTGTILGPWIGAFFIGALFAYGDIYVGGYHPILSGVLIVLVMKFMPGGIVGLAGQVPWSRMKGFVSRR